ncbi:tripartite tricarboxylate transporter permease [Vibrio lentus]|nr:tripartite tricarboxylate transporter permease [Vibrio lentus]
MAGYSVLSSLLQLHLKLATFALRFNAPEYFALALFGLTIIASVSSNNIFKGLPGYDWTTGFSPLGLTLSAVCQGFTLTSWILPAESMSSLF